MPHRSSWVGAILPVILLLSGCSERDPTAPTAEESEFVRKSLRRTVALDVSDKAKLLANGNVEIVVRALCPKGYHRQESGTFDILQGPTSGFGSIQLQLGGCSGRWETGKVLVFWTEAPFQRGPAQATVQFDVVNSNDPTEEDVLTTSVNKQITIR
jgi:hypothetical protein